MLGVRARMVESAYNDIVRMMREYWGASAAAEPEPAPEAASSSTSDPGLDIAPRLPNSEVAERMSFSESVGVVPSLEELPLPCLLPLCCVPVSGLEEDPG